MKTQLHRFVFPSRRDVFYFTLSLVLLVAIMPIHMAQAFFDWGWQDLVLGILNGILGMLGWFAGAAAAIFTFTLDPVSFHNIMDSEAVYVIWKITRDFLNMFFIAILLFSAFATIFQISSYNYKRVFLNLIIMALLVNFSWPISRAIIDFFNTMMYYFVDLMDMGGDKAAKGMLGVTNMQKLFLPENNESVQAALIAIVVLLIFTVVMLWLALLMIVRLAALPILVMLAPIGFVGMIAPFLHSYARKWWDYLLRYASIGPITVFMVLAALKVLQSVEQTMNRNIQLATVNFSANNNDALSTFIWFLIPIIFMAAALQASRKSANELSNGALKIAGAINKKVLGTLAGGLAGGLAFSGLSGGVKTAWQNSRLMTNSRLNQQAREDRIARGLSGGRAGIENANADAFNKRVAAEQERLKRLGNETEAKRLLDNRGSSQEQKKAAALYLADKELLNDAEYFNKALGAVGSDLASAKQIVSKAPKTVLKNATELSATLSALAASGFKPEKLDSLQGDLMEKVHKDALGSSKAEYDVIKSKLGSDSQKAYDKKLTAESKAHIRVNTSAQDMNAEFASIFGSMKAEDLVNQDDSELLLNDKFIEYLKTRDKTYRKEIMTSAGRRGKQAVTQKWTAEGVLAPPPAPASGSGTGTGGTGGGATP